MQINVEKTKPVVQAKTGDIAYFDDDYWLIGWWEGLNTEPKYLFTSLTWANSTNIAYKNMQVALIDKPDLTAFLENREAVIYDGKKSKLDLVIKEPATNHD